MSFLFWVNMCLIHWRSLSGKAARSMYIYGYSMDSRYQWGKIHYDYFMRISSCTKSRKFSNYICKVNPVLEVSGSLAHCSSEHHLTTWRSIPVNMFARRLLTRRPLCPGRLPSRLSLYSPSLVLISQFAMGPPPEHSTPRPLHPPREFPSNGFEVIDPSQKVEEERLPFYKCEDYYPMRMGEVVNDRYQVVAKLGYGTGSTAWLCRDLRYALLCLILIIPFTEYF